MNECVMQSVSNIIVQILTAYSLHGRLGGKSGYALASNRWGPEFASLSITWGGG